MTEFLERWPKTLKSREKKTLKKIASDANSSEDALNSKKKESTYDMKAD